MPLREHQHLDALTRHVDDEKHDRIEIVHQLPETAFRDGDQVVHVMRDGSMELCTWVNKRWFCIGISDAAESAPPAPAAEAELPYSTVITDSDFDLTYSTTISDSDFN